MKAKKKTKQVNVISIEILNYVLDGIYKRLDSIDDQLVALRNKDTELIDLDNAVTDGTNGIGVGDSDEVEFTEEELNFLKNVIIATPTRDDETGHYLGGIYHKLNKMLKDKNEEERN